MPIIPCDLREEQCFAIEIDMGYSYYVPLALTWRLTDRGRWYIGDLLSSVQAIKNSLGQRVWVRFWGIWLAKRLLPLNAVTVSKFQVVSDSS